MAENTLPLAAVASPPEQKIFKSSLLGFKRDDVLTYVSSLNKRSEDMANELNYSIDKLTSCLAVARNDHQELTSKFKNLENNLSCESARANDFEGQVQAMRLAVDRANDEAAAYKSRLYAASQEIAVLKADNSKLNSNINVLTAAINEYKSQKESDSRLAEQAIFAANTIKQNAADDAKLTRDKASNAAIVLIAAAEKEKNDAKKVISESARNIAISVSTIKAELDAVDCKIASAISELNHITSGISNALTDTENDLSALGIQLGVFPQPIKPIMPVSPVSAPQSQSRRPKKPDAASESILSKLARLLR